MTLNVQEVLYFNYCAMQAGRIVRAILSRV